MLELDVFTLRRCGRKPYSDDSAGMNQPLIIGVGGFNSDVGKTTLMCELLKWFPEWEAIKTTRGHYRSCGKDPHSCCVSHLLSEEPIVRSGRAETYEKGKDTGRYWDAGASNVHWLICTDNQVEKGIKEALARVKSPGVLVEGNSFTQFVQPDHFVMVRRADDDKMKTSARRTINKVTAVYVSDLTGDVENEMQYLPTAETPLFTPSNLFSLVGYLKWNR
jgi:molybdopterin-guanine dinucleotide biosynthesis protein